VGLNKVIVTTLKK